MKILFIALVFLLPGAWITLSPSLRIIHLGARFALAVALSPAIVGAEWLLMRLFGVRPSLVPSLLVIINLPALFFIAKRLWLERSSLRFSPGWLYGGFLFFLTTSYVFLRWIGNPTYRTFSWHALMHSDIVYALTRSSLLPEEPEIAGLALSFGWIPHISINILGSLSDWAPTSIYPVINIVMFMAAFILCYALGKHALGLSQPAAFITSSFLFLSTNILGAIVWAISDNARNWGYFLGDVRYTPLLDKYVGFETMPMGFAPLIGLVFVALLSMRVKVPHSTAMIALLLAAVGVIYPILFPVGCFIVGGVFLLRLWSDGIHKSNAKELLIFVVSMTVSVVVVVLLLFWVTQDRSIPSFQFALGGRKVKIVRVITAFLPLFILSAPYLLKSILKRDRQMLLLFAASVFSMLLYISADLENLEYKYILCAAVTMAPICAASIEHYLHGNIRIKWALAFIIPVFLLVVHTISYFQYQINRPDNLLNAPKISEGSFWIKLDPTEKDAGWVEAVRENTPENTIMVVEGSSIHLGPFLNRSLYFPGDIDGAMSTGYSNKNIEVLIIQRGYSDAVYKDRLQTVKTLFQDPDPDHLAVSLNTLLSFHRPIAIRFPSDTTPALQWLSESHIGSQIYTDSENVLWYIPNQQER